MKVLLIDGTVLGRKTGVVLEQVQTYIQAASNEYDLSLIHLADYDHQIVDGRPADAYNEDMQRLVKEITEADAYIIATPIFQGSIPGVLKNVFDLLHPKAMRYKPVSIVANGGTKQHHLVVENQLKPILDYFRCLVTPNYVYTYADHFDQDNTISSEDVHLRLRELARVFVQYVEMSKHLCNEPIDRM